MNFRACLSVALATLGLAWSASLHAQTSDPRVGHWAEQRYPGSAGLHVTYENLGDGRFRFTIGAHYAPANQQIVEAKCDGGTYPFVSGTGVPSGNTLSCRAAGALAIEYLYTQSDSTAWATSTGVETVSADRNTLTLAATHRDAAGKAVEELHRRFSRRDDEPRR